MSSSHHRDDDPPIEIPGWYRRLQNRGRAVIHLKPGIRRLTVSWLEIQEGRRFYRQLLTGKLRAQSVMQAVAMLLFGFWFLVIDVLTGLAFHTSPDLIDSSYGLACLTSATMVIGWACLSVLIGGIMSVKTRSWQRSDDGDDPRPGMYERNPVTTLLTGHIRTRNPLYLTVMMVMGISLILPTIFIIQETISRQGPSRILSPELLSEQIAIFLCLGFLPLIFGVMLLVSVLQSLLPQPKVEDEPS